MWILFCLALIMACRWHFTEKIIEVWLNNFQLALRVFIVGNRNILKSFSANKRNLIVHEWLFCKITLQTWNMNSKNLWYNIHNCSWSRILQNLTYLSTCIHSFIHYLWTSKSLNSKCQINSCLSVFYIVFMLINIIFYDSIIKLIFSHQTKNKLSIVKIN